MRRTATTVAIALVLATAACGTDEADAPPPPEASTIPAVCGPLGARSRCAPSTHLEPRSPAAQEDCKQGIAERRCGEARFLYERCLYDNPLCFGDDGAPTNDDAGRCLADRTRWESCEADAGP